MVIDNDHYHQHQFVYQNPYQLFAFSLSQMSIPRKSSRSKTLQKFLQWILNITSPQVDQEQRISRRSSVSPHSIALAAAVDREQEVFHLYSIAAKSINQCQIHFPVTWVALGGAETEAWGAANGRSPAGQQDRSRAGFCFLLGWWLNHTRLVSTIRI